MNPSEARQLAILKKLYASVTPINAQALCAIFSVSMRTIRYDISQLKKTLTAYDVALIMKSGQGYAIRNRDKIKLLSFFDEAFDGSNQGEQTQRSLTVLLRLLTHRRAISLSQLSSTLFLSESATSKLIQSINTDIQSWSCEITVTHQGYALIGSEHQQRLLLAHLIVSAIGDQSMMIDYYDILPDIIKARITNDRFKLMTLILDRANQHYHVWLSQHHFVNLVAYLIAIDIRRNIGMQEDYDEFFLDELFMSERTYTIYLFKELFPKEKSPHEHHGFIAFLINEGILVHAASSQFSVHLVAEIIEFLKQEQYAMDFVSLEDDLNKHIAGSIKRQRVEYSLEPNPLFNQIKEQHHVHFKLAQRINEKVIQPSDYRYLVSDDELSYIAIYLYKNELKKPEIQHPKVYVACASSRGVSKLIETRIKHVFPQIEVMGTLTINQLLDRKHYQDADFIISTIPIKQASVPIVHVTQLLNVKDIEQIQHLLNYGLTARIIPNTASVRLNEYIEKQFEGIGESTLISIEKLSIIILNLVDALMSLEAKFNVTDQKILGILLHCILALPRWFDPVDIQDKYSIEVLLDIKEKYHNIYVQFESTFDLIERELGIILNPQERLSFFDYIIERDLTL